MCRGHKIAADVARGLMHMHRNGFVHQDLKSKNILVNQHWTAKVSSLACVTPALCGPSSVRTNAHACLLCAAWSSADPCEPQMFCLRLPALCQNMPAWDRCPLHLLMAVAMLHAAPLAFNHSFCLLRQTRLCLLLFTPSSRSSPGLRKAKTWLSASIRLH